MPIRFKCAECGASMKIKDELAGTKGHCPKCKTEFVVPAAEVAEKVEATAAVREKTDEVVTEESLEDEYQRILMGDGPVGGARARPDDSDAFLSVEPSDDPPSGVSSSARSRQDPKSDPPPTRSGKSTAEIS